MEKITPRIAVIDRNTLEAAGLRAIITDMAPMVEVCTFASLEEMLRESNSVDETVPFVHFFVSSQVLVAHADFFLSRQRQTIILTSQAIAGKQFEHFRMLDVSLPERDLLRAILLLFRHAHGAGHASRSEAPALMSSFRNVPENPSLLSPRETEVLSLVVRGFINKEIAERLCISLPTVVTHRKNLCEKLRVRSVSALTIYAVTHGIVPVEEI
ncbi:MAG: LuxR C-terminal-related transcriptional regulator [Bacteroidaceae bacterium]|nr:LuxR C-terminal-related transcriptional regulator [Bacteroidaceae bacterium]